MIAIVDYGMGNLRSLEGGLKRIGCEVLITRDSAKIKESQGLVLPGVGSFRDCMRNLKKNNLIQPILNFIASGRPFLGICLGLQAAVVEFSRNVCGLADANSTEMNKETKNKVITLMDEQQSVVDMGGTMRLGAYGADLAEGIISKLYKNKKVSERHRHRYEVNPAHHKILTEKGLFICGLSPSGTLAEFIELPTHRYFVATQAHPELKSKLEKPAPLFYGLVKAAMQEK